MAGRGLEQFAKEKDNAMDKTKFIYVTYIRTTQEKLWQALIQPEFTRVYWLETWQESEWEKGASWRALNPEKQVIAMGEVVEYDQPQRLVLTWRNEKTAELRAEGFSRVTYTLEKEGASVRLTVLHEVNQPGSKLLQSVSQGWPLVLASLKSLLETGEPLDEARRWPVGGCK